MKEKLLTPNKIIETLEKRSFMEINPMCADCISDLIPYILDVFCNVHIDIFQVEDDLYVLRISV